MKQKKELSKGAASGIVALIFLVLGFQVAMFVTRFSYRVAEEQQEVAEQQGEQQWQGQQQGYQPGHEEGQPLSQQGRETTGGQRAVSSSKSAAGGGSSRSGRTKFGGYPTPKPSYSSTKSNPPKKELPKPFEFDPNSVTAEQLQELGLSQRQAEVIINYREKGGKFRKKEDFAKMYVVSDELFARLEPYINIAKVELNSADSTALVSLYGIGPYFAKKILAYRERLGGFFHAEQLLEIDGMDEERFAGLRDYITVDSLKIKSFQLWSLPQDSISKHPYIGSYAAKGIVRYRSLCDSSQWKVANLVENGILTPDKGDKLRRYVE